ncbi:MAG: molecular chaperone GroES [Gemmatimonas sp. SG8_38_2]|nr:MAG: molecular chaperone GroES [Gemmatimonas sp. SG8_38_2]
MPRTKSETAKQVEVRPLGDRVLIRPLEETESMRGGLYIPDTAKEKPQQGEVLAVGPGRIEDGKRILMEVEVGQRVLYGKYTGSELTLNDEQLLFVRESEILAVVS